MLRNLHALLFAMNLEHHKLYPLQDNLIYIGSKTLDPEGIDEVMRIKKLADGFPVQTIWDGQDIQIKLE